VLESWNAMKIALAQINPTVGDVEGNTARILEQIAQARAQAAELILVPELAIVGYPPKDLLLRKRLIERNLAAVEQIAAASADSTIVVGCVREAPAHDGPGLHNAAAICQRGSVVAWYAKRLLPSYDVFDETRYFTPGSEILTVEVPTRDRSQRVGITVCEDLWNNSQFEGRHVYGLDPIVETAAAQVDLLVNISASPYEVEKHHEREHLFGRQVAHVGVPLAWVNQVGGNDDLLFDGASLVMNNDGKVAARAPAFEEVLLVVDIERGHVAAGPPHTAGPTPYPDDLESIRRGLVMGTRDYVRKCGFRDVLIGLSGGIDSAVTAALAVEALGPEHVHGVAMPSRFSSDHSVADAEALARNLGIELFEIPIEPAHAAMEEMLAPCFGGRPADVTEENIQARTRGNILMSLSNKFGWLLLTTGNKSELAVGYCTLYGDMCGGLAVISDVPKTTVYALAKHINATTGRPCIPERTISKPPSAELREDQCDQDSLPPYDALDAILERYVEREQSVEEIVAAGFDGDTVRRVLRLVDHSEYKRRQAAVGLKVTSRAFGTGRRMPIAARGV
jgi:NAD+ synthase (glutamine-hydrolysing)